MPSISDMIAAHPDELLPSLNRRAPPPPQPLIQRAPLAAAHPDELQSSSPVAELLPFGVCSPVARNWSVGSGAPPLSQPLIRRAPPPSQSHSNAPLHYEVLLTPTSSSSIIAAYVC
ncbi:hypothetical protein FMUND_3801 [Fusarium mundagurra]|uniref:Uncharacterized protein n=1 Tax=Fusarium mundagurra TaxID=1567541 RepID=A0A8H5YZG3_9HYPO|nr:hypothetical protein FMUND_3801 [Fusarium mundagurra]